MGSINNSFRFGTVDSADYNLLVAGDGTFNAPERDVDTIEIPGRNGDLLIDKGRFKNITVEYTVYCYADDLETFRTQLRNFRNALSSQKGYQKLTDTFHPDEYRLGTFISGFEAEPVMFNTVAEAVLKFDCKPQRFLLSGDESITLGEWGENPNILVNPTHFTAQPVFEVEGSGTLTVNNISMIIANNGTTVIDSEMMEAYEEENGAIISRNDMVSGEFPTLKEGNNNIGTVGLTSVKVTPKWWEV